MEPSEDASNKIQHEEELFRKVLYTVLDNTAAANQVLNSINYN